MASQQQQFNLILNSDASLDLNPENKANNFKVQLAQRITQTAKLRHEVALKEIIVPSQLNYKQADQDLWLQVHGYKSNDSRRKYLPGLHFYDDEQDLLSTLDKAIGDLVAAAKTAGDIDEADSIKLMKTEKLKYKFPLEIEIKTHMRQLETYDDWKNSPYLNSIILSKELCHMLGIDTGTDNSIYLLAPNYYHHFYENYKKG